MICLASAGLKLPIEKGIFNSKFFTLFFDLQEKFLRVCRLDICFKLTEKTSQNSSKVFPSTDSYQCKSKLIWLERCLQSSPGTSRIRTQNELLYISWKLLIFPFLQSTITFIAAKGDIWNLPVIQIWFTIICQGRIESSRLLQRPLFRQYYGTFSAGDPLSSSVDLGW